jgi:hypothetical protein
MAAANPLTSELKNLAVTNAGNPRVTPTGVFAPSLPINLATAITAAQTAGNLAVFGTDPYLVLGVETFDDFGTAGNFERVAAAASGGVAREAISQPATARIGLRKTGRFERLQLPAVSDLYLSFRMGLMDGAPPPATFDGVRYRVLLRDAARELHVLYDRDWRGFAWTRPAFVDLTPFAGQVVDLSLEVHARNDAAADRALWGEPTIGRYYHLSVAPGGLGSGSIAPSPGGHYAPGTVVNLNATAGPGSVFVVWTTTGAPGDIADRTATATTITMNGNHDVEAKFGFTSTFTSTPANDGWILESTATSGVGGSLNATSNTTSSLRAGDDASRRQFLSVVSFDTSPMPDTATVTSATLTLRRGTAVGSPNTAAFGALLVDVVPGFFGPSAALQTADFADAPTGLAVGAGTLGFPATNGAAATGALGSAGRAAVNAAGLTQFRVRFANGDDGDAANDYLGFYSGETTTTTLGVTNKPTLVVTYY